MTSGITDGQANFLQNCYDVSYPHSRRTYVTSTIQSNRQPHLKSSVCCRNVKRRRHNCMRNWPRQELRGHVSWSTWILTSTWLRMRQDYACTCARLWLSLRVILLIKVSCCLACSPTLPGVNIHFPSLSHCASVDSSALATLEASNHMTAGKQYDCTRKVQGTDGKSDNDICSMRIALQIISLTQQLALLQSMNSKASRPFALEMTNVSGRTEASLEKRMSQYTEWQGAEVNRQPYIDAYAGRKEDLVSVSSSPTLTCVFAQVGIYKPSSLDFQEGKPTPGVLLLAYAILHKRDQIIPNVSGIRSRLILIAFPVCRYILQQMPVKAWMTSLQIRSTSLAAL